MQRFILEKPVSISGHDFLGRRATVCLEPIDAQGWYWHMKGADIAISPAMLASKRNRVVLTHERRELHVFEHLGALRFSGLDGIRIRSSQKWLPYDGSSMLFWRACAPHMRPEGTLRAYTVAGHTSVVEHKQGIVREVFYDPAPRDALVTDVLIDYPSIGLHRQSWHFPNSAFEKIARVKTQGWPPYRRVLAGAAGALGWPHRDNAVWPQEHDSMLVQRLFARHRSLDILGALGVLCPAGGMLTGTFTSRRAGHAQDISLVKKARIRLAE